MDTPVYADRSERGKLEFTGPQRGWFLHQIMTQSFEDMEVGDARTTALLTAHGRIVGYGEAIATEDAVLLHFEPELSASWPDAIRRYVFATQVEIRDVTEERGLVLVAGPGARDIAGAVEDALAHPTPSLGVEAVYLWCDRERIPAVVRSLAASGALPATEDDLEAIRIVHGVARWGREIDERSFPQEVGIDSHAVHFDKGCYVGQEAMAKIHFRGKVNRRLARLEAAGPLRAGADVTLDGSRVGTVTSASNGVALAIVRHTVEPGAQVDAGGTPATVRS